MSGNTDERRVFDEFLKRKGLKVTRERTAVFD
jgi:Fe2+ or Zn2+ uptake regulation protein